MSKVVKAAVQNLGPHVHALDDEGRLAIHTASLEILEQTGCHVPVAEARSLSLAMPGRASTDIASAFQQTLSNMRWQA